MIDRYTRAEMGRLWTSEARFSRMLDVETAVALAQAKLKIIPRKAAEAIAKRGKFSLPRILELEAETKHDVIAFVSNVAENVGPEGRYVHFGMTSSDVLDTALSLQIRDASTLLNVGLGELIRTMTNVATKHERTVCAGRTHGMFAEPTTFGLKLMGHVAELKRAQVRLAVAASDLRIVKLSGAVGTYSSQPPEVEKEVGKILKLEPEVIATQVIPRDRHAALFAALALLGGAIERISIELRHLQRSEVGEVTESFSKGQKGSSAMPHKKNPISSENLTGISRLLRGYMLAAFENIALWHERDISHSSVERVILPDSFILADYAVHRLNAIFMGLQVHEKRMLENMSLSQGQLFSSQVLLALVEKGLSREQAYGHVQRLSHSLGKGDHLKNKLLEDREVGKLLSAQSIEKIFSGARNQTVIGKVMKRVRL